MRHLAPLLLAPLLLAPIRIQSGEDSFTLQAAQGPAPSATLLPAAAPLSSPTVITLSPTLFLLPTPTAVTATPTVTVIPPPAKQLMPVTTAAICRKALETAAELAINSYGQRQSQPLMNLTIAATAAAAQAGNRTYPNLQPVTENFAKLAFTTPQRAEIATLVNAAQKACANPAGHKPAPGSVLPVERPR